jgi:hypothetical protein
VRLLDGISVLFVGDLSPLVSPVASSPAIQSKRTPCSTNVVVMVFRRSCRPSSYVVQLIHSCVCRVQFLFQDVSRSRLEPYYYYSPSCSAICVPQSSIDVRLVLGLNLGNKVPPLLFGSGQRQARYTPEVGRSNTDYQLSHRRKMRL